MAVTNILAGNFPLNCARKLVTDLETDTVKGCLLTSSYTFNQDTHTAYSDLTNEVSASGTNYSTGGNALTGCAISYASRVTTWGIASPYTLTFTSLTVPDYRYLWLYDFTPAAAADKKLITCIDLGATYAAVASNVVFTFNSAGIWTMTVSAT
jgi:hypothetical protein